MSLLFSFMARLDRFLSYLDIQLGLGFFYWLIVSAVVRKTEERRLIGLVGVVVNSDGHMTSKKSQRNVTKFILQAVKKH
jgi:hypothetical protein